MTRDEHVNAGKIVRIAKIRGITNGCTLHLYGFVVATNKKHLELEPNESDVDKITRGNSI